MGTEVSIDLSQAARAELALRRFTPVMGQAIKRGLDAGMQEVKGLIESERLTGKGPYPAAQHKLGVVTGKLREQANAQPAQVITESGELVQVRASLGSSIRYAAVHEFGFDGEVTVRSFQRKAHQRRTGETFIVYNGRSKKHETRERTRTIAAHTVKEHTRRMHMPARAPFQTGLSEHREVIAGRISAAIITAAREATMNAEG